MEIRIKRLLQIFLVISFISLGIFAQSESSIPANFTTYTDETRLFSISYPVDWEPDLLRIKTLKQETEEYMESINSMGTLEKSNIVFFGGAPLGNGYYNPNMSILVELFSGDKFKLEDLVELTVQGWKKEAEEYHEFSRTKTIIDGKQAIILDYEARYPNIGASHNLLTVILTDRFVWILSFGVIPPLNFNDFKEDIYTTTRSFKILSNPPES
jgi:hypothetical protein